MYIMNNNLTNVNTRLNEEINSHVVVFSEEDTITSIIHTLTHALTQFKYSFRITKFGL